MSPSLSVLITAYGPAPFLAEALRSVRDQVDLSPTDDIVLLTDRPRDLEALGWPPKAPLPPLRLVKLDEPQKGKFFAAGFQACRGEVVATLNDDDIWEPQKIQVVRRAFEGNSSAAYHHHGVSFFGLGPVRPPGRHRHARRRDGDQRTLVRGSRGWERSLGRYDLGFNDSSISLRRDLVLSHLPWFERIDAGEDTFLLFCALTSAKELLLDPRSLTRYRVHASNSSVSGNRDAPAAADRLHREFERRLKLYQVLESMVGSCAPEREEVRAWAQRGVRLSEAVLAVTGSSSSRRTLMKAAAGLLDDWDEFDPPVNLAVSALASLGVASRPLATRVLFQLGIRTDI
ncbi:MAG: glycosyltransferase family 2 protein [Euryarchaeota archaeon]|nr:glycosyltransferase family 2 protein [Euryarchaeota archaeon]MDE1837242.1 glycosyltransferase family 2 protein [Euryarchaeota archaeon]MDE1881613.1 glycosyltransferase family 2 protein [Euryarchaeota archaeon]MDE2045154.1 glycosyltransferase family 2 protein [Thermoplasmata archaeon]